MKQRAFRWIIAIGTISIVSILIIQIFWVKRAYDIRENEFNDAVSRALTSVSDDFFELNQAKPPTESPVKRFDSNYYLVMINSPIDGNVLDYLLKKEFKQQNIFTDFEYGIYDCDTEAMVYGEYINNTLISNPVKQSTLPVWGEENYYFGVLFPSKTGYIINNMDTWVFTSVLMLILTGFFSYALVVILKQRRLSQVQKDFINNMTHEFKTPISTISVSAEVLMQPEIVKDETRLKKYAGIIESENNRLKKQVDRVLQMALLDRDTIKLNKEEVDVHRLIKDVMDTHTISSPHASLSCSLDAQNHFVMGDPLHLSNMVYNLVDNAIKYAEQDAKVEINTRNEGHQIIVQVKDNGPGIPLQYRKKIFSRFFRIPTGNLHNVKGFGLGLHYVMRMAKAHGGTIEIENNTHDGSIFRLSLIYEK